MWINLLPSAAVAAGPSLAALGGDRRGVGLVVAAPGVVAVALIGSLGAAVLVSLEGFQNRFLGLLKNPFIELALGKLGAVLDAQRLIQEGAIVIINLEPGGVLRD